MKNLFKALTFSDTDIDALRAYHAEYADAAPPSREDFLEYSHTGNRLGYENKYFALRHRLNGAFMLWRAEMESYIYEVQSLILSVCDEYTWALPAHISDMESARTEIDLFAAETAMTLAEMVYFADGALGADLENRIRTEIHERIFEPFSKTSYHWEKSNHNWAAVCGGAIGIAYLRLAPEEILLDRILGAMDAYLSGFKGDGICLEGIGYWSYGFGFYMYFADALLRERGIDIIHAEKIRKIAEFPTNAALSRGAYVTCSDAPEDFKAPEGLMGLLKEYYGVSAAVKTEKTDECGRWAHFIRSYLYPCNSSGKPRKGEFVYEPSQWYVNRAEKYGFFIKGGTNDEPHNHNDIGSFIIADDGGQLLCDIGMGEYTRDYFDDAARYNYLCASSFGHSVPIIDGCGQNAGGERRADMFERADNRVVISFGRAYGDGIRIMREIRLDADKITLRDTFSFADGKPHTVTERFVSVIEPEVRGENVVIGGMRIDKTGEIKTEIIRAHDGSDRAVYLIDIPSGNEFEAVFGFEA